MIRAAVLALLFPSLALAATPLATNDTLVIRLALDLVDGSLLIGTPAITSVTAHTSFARLDIPFRQIAAITLSDNAESASFELLNGDRIKGVPDWGPLELQGLFGKAAIRPTWIRSMRVLTSDTSQTDSLVFWNKLGSEKEVLNSEVGPGLRSFEGGDWPDVAGSRRYVPGRHGTAVTLSGSHANMGRVRNLVLKDLETILDPERGCIEVWYQQEGPPVGYSHGVYRIFDGPYGVGSGLSLYVVPEGLFFAVGLGGKGAGVNLPITEIPSGEWMHLAAVWSRMGLEGSSETLRLYLNGKKVGSTTGKDWGTQAEGKADIGGANDNNCSGKFALDNLKIWSRPKTDFSDRLRE